MALDINQIDEITPDEEDTLGPAYIRDKLERRARMAAAAFIVGLGGGTAVIAVGLFKAGAAERIDHMGTFLGIFFGALFSFVAAYMGLGSYELRNNPYMGQGPYSGRAARRLVYPRGDVAGRPDYRNDLGSRPEGTGGAGLGLDDQDEGNVRRSD